MLLQDRQLFVWVCGVVINRAAAVVARALPTDQMSRDGLGVKSSVLPKQRLHEQLNAAHPQRRGQPAPREGDHAVAGGGHLEPLTVEADGLPHVGQKLTDHQPMCVIYDMATGKHSSRLPKGDPAIVEAVRLVGGDGHTRGITCSPPGRSRHCLPACIRNLDPATGDVISETTVYSPDPETGIQPTEEAVEMRGLLSDVMLVREVRRWRAGWYCCEW